jgi:hypothetical protein
VKKSERDALAKETRKLRKAVEEKAALDAAHRAEEERQRRLAEKQRAKEEHEAREALARKIAGARRARWWLAVVAVLATIVCAVIAAAPNVESRPTNHDDAIILTAFPRDETRFLNGVTGGNLFFTIQEQRDFAQDVGLAPRTPTLKMDMRYSVPWNESYNRDALDLILHVSNGINAIRVPDLAAMTQDQEPGETSTVELVMGDWQTLETRQKQITIKPIVSILETPDGPRASSQVWVEFKIDPPTVSQSSSDGRWLQSWEIQWEPPQTPFDWLAVDTDEKDWELQSASDIEKRVAGGVQIGFCASCDIVNGYNGALEISRDSYAEAKESSIATSVEVSTNWRPWSVVGPSLAGFIGLVIATVAGIIGTVVLERVRYRSD